MFQDFKAFVMRGNVMDLAIAVIIGGAFAGITKSLTDDIIMPVIGWLFGGFDFSSYFIILGKVPPTYHGSLANYAELKAAGASLFGYGEFITVLINFLILAFIIFLLVRAVNRLMSSVEHKKEVVEELAPADPADVVLLREILAELKSQRGAS